MDENPIVLFDGECLLCNKSVQFLLKNEEGDHLRFASLQSKTGQNLLGHYSFPLNYSDSIVFIHNGVAYTHSTAVLKVAKYLKWKWQWLRFLYIIPTPVRDYIYKWVAKNRISWFGKTDSCMFLTSDLKKKFLEY